MPGPTPREVPSHRGLEQSQSTYGNEMLSEDRGHQMSLKGLLSGTSAVDGGKSYRKTLW